MSSISTHDEPGPSHFRDSSDLASLQEREDTPSWEPRSLCSALESASKRASVYERQIKELESKLALDLSNSRAIETLLHEVFAGIEQTRKRTEYSLSNTVTSIGDMLEEDDVTLDQLEEQLPAIGERIRTIRQVYDHGRDKARQLMASLEWLNTPVSQRLQTIIFTPHAPVSKRWKAFVRAVFALALCACMWIAWITFAGAVRAHRQRLVWGERLMS